MVWNATNQMHDIADMVMGALNKPQLNVKYDTFCAKMHNERVAITSHPASMQNSIIVESIL